ncbi:MAG: hypothetical protein HWQ38_32260 [Nostoc sp. NMS7]|uniref:hypothetical protein n=1 Tax=Nostoc sp. NMS7 TaxID=2815391 RepID=UPI0025DF3A66|nr:hypothetical protein [Nostoc sp. NMS7]MBN3950891.1 hypothetical protein [Nostoc sp. NMS7]
MDNTIKELLCTLTNDKRCGVMLEFEDASHEGSIPKPNFVLCRPVFSTNTDIYTQRYLARYTVLTKLITEIILIFRQTITLGEYVGTGKQNSAILGGIKLNITLS